MLAQSPPAVRQPFRRPLRLGLAGALLVYTGLVLLALVAQPLFMTGDESAHVDYAFDVTHGRIPTLHSSRIHEFPELGQAGPRQYVSNHPPAYHALIGPFVRAADASEHPRAFLMLARALTAAIGGAVLVTLASTAATLFRSGSREQAVVMIATVSFAGSLAVMVASSANIRNDALAVLMVCATVLVLARAARSGQRLGSVCLVAAFCTLGMVTRIAFLPVWLLAICAVAALELWPRLSAGRPTWRHVRRGVLSALLVLVLPLAGAGWFYGLSLSRYGDPTGGSTVYAGTLVAERELLPGAEHGPLAYMLLPTSWWAQVRQLGGAGASISPTYPIHSVLGVAAIGILLIAVVAGLLRGRLRAGLLDGPARWTMVGLALIAIAMFAELAWHASHKGSDSQRYLLAGIGFWAMASATVVASAPRRLAPSLVASVAGLLAIGSVLRTSEAPEYAGHYHRVVSSQDARGVRPDAGWYETLVHGTELAGFPAGHLVVPLLLLTVAAGLALQLVALRRIAAGPIAASQDEAPRIPVDPSHARGTNVVGRRPLSSNEDTSEADRPDPLPE